MAVLKENSVLSVIRKVALAIETLSQITIPQATKVIKRAVLMGFMPEVQVTVNYEHGFVMGYLVPDFVVDKQKGIRRGISQKIKVKWYLSLFKEQIIIEP